jgi:hypothetical protein
MGNAVTTLLFNAGGQDEGAVGLAWGLHRDGLGHASASAVHLDSLIELMVAQTAIMVLDAAVQAEQAGARFQGPVGEACDLALHCLAMAGPVRLMAASSPAHPMGGHAPAGIACAAGRVRVLGQAIRGSRRRHGV